MSTTTILNKITPKKKLLDKLNKAGGIVANRNSLKDLQTFFSNEVAKPNVEQIRATAWRTK